MRLAIIFPSTIDGGCERYALAVAKAAVEKGWSVHVLFPKRDGTRALRERFESCGATSVCLEITENGDRSNQAFGAHFRRFVRSLKGIRRVSPDVCLLANPSIQYLSGTILACAVLRIPSLICFQYVQNVYRFSAGRRFFYRFARRRSQRWVCVSEQNRLLLAESLEIPKEELTVVYNGSKPAPELPDPRAREEIRRRVREGLDIPVDSTVFLTMAALRIQKGHTHLIDAVKLVRDASHDACWLLAGDGPELKDLERQVAKAGLGGVVHFLGRRDDVTDLMFGSDFFVFPTLYEGHPFALLEAMSTGLPVVSTDASSIPEIIEDGVHGILCAAGDASALSQAMLRALNTPESMRSMARNALERAAEFTELRMTDHTLAILSDLFFSTYPTDPDAV